MQKKPCRKRTQNELHLFLMRALSASWDGLLASMSFNRREKSAARSAEFSLSGDFALRDRPSLPLFTQFLQSLVRVTHSNTNHITHPNTNHWHTHGPSSSQSTMHDAVHQISLSRKSGLLSSRFRGRSD